jgi:hypothetical protein
VGIRRGSVSGRRAVAAAPNERTALADRQRSRYAGGAQRLGARVVGRGRGAAPAQSGADAASTRARLGLRVLAGLAAPRPLPSTPAPAPCLRSSHEVCSAAHLNANPPETAQEPVRGCAVSATLSAVSRRFPSEKLRYGRPLVDHPGLSRQSHAERPFSREPATPHRLASAGRRDRRSVFSEGKRRQV